MSTSTSASAIDAALARGVAWLADARGPAGLWRDYSRPDGSAGSTVWASGFVAAHVGRIPAARPVAAAVVDRLVAGRRPRGGWGYDESLLEDCDSTAWVLLAAEAAAVRLPREVLIPSLRFVLRHQGDAGGFVTYGPEGLHLFGDIAERAGWFTPQPCVTAAALAALAAYAPSTLPELGRAADWLASAAAPALWPAYWWYGPTYATYLSVRALRRLGRLSPARAESIAAALLRERNTDGGWSGMHADRGLPFTTALALLALLELGHTGPELEAAAALLLESQAPGGSFGASAELLVPGGVSADPMTLLDRGCFTAACVLHALHDYRTAIARRSAPSHEESPCRSQPLHP